MEQLTQQIKGLVVDAENYSHELSCQMSKLKAVQVAVARVLEGFDEIEFKGWHEDPVMARLSVKEIMDSVRLIDMGFLPLFKEMQNSVNKLDKASRELHDIIAKHNGGMPSVNSLTGCNYRAMENKYSSVYKRVWTGA